MQFSDPISYENKTDLIAKSERNGSKFSYKFKSPTHAHTKIKTLKQYKFNLKNHSKSTTKIFTQKFINHIHNDRTNSIWLRKINRFRRKKTDRNKTCEKSDEKMTQERCACTRSLVGADVWMINCIHGKTYYLQVTAIYVDRMPAPINYLLILFQFKSLFIHNVSHMI